MTNEDKEVKEWLKQCQEIINEIMEKTDPFPFIKYQVRLSVNKEKASKVRSCSILMKGYNFVKQGILTKLRPYQ